jgi:hypothetical protein
MSKVTDPALISLLNDDQGLGNHFTPQESTPAPRVTDDMGLVERMLAGYGRGVTALGQGTKQLALHAGGALDLVDPKAVSDYDKDVATEAELYNRDLGQTGSGKFGNFVGQAVTTIPIGGIGGKAAGVLASAGKTALQGGAAAALEPVEDVRQPTTVADLVSGNEPQGEDFLTAKLGQAATGAAMGAGGNVALRGAGALVEKAKNAATLPFRATAGKEVVDAAQKGAAASPAKDFIDESDALSKETGVQFTPGQSTGSKGLTTMEQKARQSARTSDQVFALDNTATKALDDYVTKVMNNTAKNAASPEQTGDLVRTAINSKVGKIEQARRAQADMDYGAVRQASGGQPIIQPDNLRTALADIKTEYGGAPTKAAQKFSAFADQVNKSDIDNVDKLLQLRRQMSRVAGGQDSISGENVDRKAATAILSAIDNDLDASAQRLGGTNVGDLLKTANANYRSASQQIDYLRKSPLGKLLGEEVTNGDASFNTIAPEKLIARLKSMTPSEVSTTRAMMQDQSAGTQFAGSLADAWQQAKRTLIQDALDKARTAAPSSGANTLAMQPNAFVRALNGHTAQGKAWATAMFEPNELAQLNNAFRAAQRLGDKTGYNFSGTAAQLEADPTLLGAAGSALKGNFGTAAGKLSGAIGKMLTSSRLAAAMADPNGRKALLQLERLPPGAAKARELTAYLATLVPLGGKPGEAENADQQE